MACRLIVLLLALFSVSAFAHDDKPRETVVQQHWRHGGGEEHFFVSTVIGVGCANVFRDSFGKAWACAMVPGTVKELIDATQAGNKFSGKDMAFNAMGAALGVSVGHFALRRQDGQTVVSYSTRF